MVNGEQLRGLLEVQRTGSGTALLAWELELVTAAAALAPLFEVAEEAALGERVRGRNKRSC